MFRLHGFGVRGLSSRVGFRVEGLEFRVWGVEFTAWSVWSAKGYWVMWLLKLSSP